MEKTYVQKANEDRSEHRLFQRDWSTEAVTGLICEEMERQGVSRAELARRLGVTRSAVTQILDEENNKTIHALSDVLFELGQSLEFYCRPLSQVTDEPPANIFGTFSFSSSWSEVGSLPQLGATRHAEKYDSFEITSAEPLN